MSYQIHIIKSCTQLNTKIDIRYACRKAISKCHFCSTCEHLLNRFREKKNKTFHLASIFKGKRDGMWKWRREKRKIGNVCLQKISRKLESRGRNFFLVCRWNFFFFSPSFFAIFRARSLKNYIFFFYERWFGFHASVIKGMEWVVEEG